MRKIFLTLVLGTLAGSVHAEGFMPWTDVMKAFDTDNDGGVSMAEAGNAQAGSKFIGFQPFMKDHFAELDTNKDGEVDQAELSAMMKSKQWTDKGMVNQFYKNTGFMATNPENQH